MTSVNAKLFHWLRLRRELEDASLRLRDAIGDQGASGADIEALQELVNRLKSQTESVLNEIDQLRAAAEEKNRRH